MPSLIKISQAATIALHALDYIISRDEKIYIASKISNDLNVSYNHLSKILQILARQGYLKTSRGPVGGYKLTEKGKKSTIKEIIELFDGKLVINGCLMDKKVCKRDECILKRFNEKMLKEFENITQTEIKNL